jgi:hypothetical protein
MEMNPFVRIERAAGPAASKVHLITLQCGIFPHPRIVLCYGPGEHRAPAEFAPRENETWHLNFWLKSVAPRLPNSNCSAATR